MKHQMPPLLSSEVLRDLALSDHVKYLYTYFSCLERVRSGDVDTHTLYVMRWFYSVNLIARYISRRVAIEFISDTYPPGYGPYPRVGVSLFEFLYHKAVGNPLYRSHEEVCVGILGKEYRCCFCGQIMYSKVVFCRYGLPSCVRCMKREGGNQSIRLYVHSDVCTGYYTRYLRALPDWVKLVSTPLEAEVVHLMTMGDTITGPFGEILQETRLQKYTTVLLRGINDGSVSNKSGSGRSGVVT